MIKKLFVTDNVYKVSHNVLSSSVYFSNFITMSVSGSKSVVCDIEKIVSTIAATEVSTDDELQCGQKLHVISDISDIECPPTGSKTLSPVTEGCKRKLFQPSNEGFASTSRTLQRLNLIPATSPAPKHKRQRREKKQRTLMDQPLIPMTPTTQQQTKKHCSASG